MRKLLVGIVCLFLPVSTQAAVYISEVAWMGSPASANHEWIELHNDGTETDVTGWILEDGMNLSIELSGKIGAGKYVVLERKRSDEGSVVDNPFLIYTGALVNTGAVLKLKRADGSLVDQVNGGENWENIGGDNTTKETAQYTTAGWATAASTPESGSVSESAVTTNATTTEVATVTKKSSGSSKLAVPKQAETVRLELPNVTLKLNVDAQSVGYVNQAIPFSVEATDVGDTLIDSLQYEWNFGDGSVASVKEVEHIFNYPGTYVVTIYAGYKRQEQVARHEITILPVSISMTRNKQGDVQVNNDSPYELDVSQYQLLAEKQFTFPKRSIILPNQTITIPAKKLGDTTNKMVGLYDTEKVLLTSMIPDSIKSSVSQSNQTKTDNPTPQISGISDSRPSTYYEGFAFLPPTEEDTVSESSYTPTSTQVAAAISADTDINKLPYLALALVLLIAIISVFLVPRSSQKE